MAAIPPMPSETALTSPPEAKPNYGALSFDLGNRFNAGPSLLDRPDVRLDRRLAVRQIEKQHEDLQIKRHIDVNDALPIIQKDIDEKQSYHDHLMQSIAEHQALMNKPYPVRQGLGLDMPEQLAAAVGMLFSHGKGSSDILAASQKNAQARKDLQYENDTNKWHAEQEQLGRDLQFKQQLAQETQAHIYHLQDRSDAIRAQQEQRAGIDQDKWEHEYATGKTGREVQAAADWLAAHGQAKDPEIVKQAVASAERTAYLKDLQQEVQLYESPYNTPADKERLQNLASSLATYYKQEPYIVSGSGMAKTQQAKANAEIRGEDLKQKNEIAKKRADDYVMGLKLRDTEAKARLAAELGHWDVEHQDRVSALKQAMTLGEERIAVEKIRAGGTSEVHKINGEIADLQGKLQSVKKASNALPKPVRGSEDYAAWKKVQSAYFTRKQAIDKQIETIQADIEGKQAKVKYVQGRVQEDTGGEPTDDGYVSPMDPEKSYQTTPKGTKYKVISQ